MKKLIYILSLLLIGTLTLNGQKISHNNKLVSYNQTIVAEGTVVAGVDSANWEAGLKSYYYAITEAARPSIDTMDKFNDYYYGLDTADIIDSLDRLFWFGAKNYEMAMLDMVTATATADTVSSSLTLPT